MMISIVPSSFSSIKKAHCSVPKTPGDIHSEKTGLESWVQVNIVLIVRKKTGFMTGPSHHSTSFQGMTVLQE